MPQKQESEAIAMYPEEYLQTLVRRQVDRGVLAEMTAGEPRALGDEVLVDGRISDLKYRKVLIESEPGWHVPVHFLFPEVEPKALVVAIPGHGRGASDVLGIVQSDYEANHIRSHGYDFGLGLARAGYAVMTVELRGIGELLTERDAMLRISLQQKLREVESAQQKAIVSEWMLWMSSCARLSADMVALNRCLLKARMWDCRCALKYAMEHGLGAHGVAILGFSMGGLIAGYLGLAEPQTSAIVLSCCLRCEEDNIGSSTSCPCTFVPGSLVWGGRERIFGLLAPRPVMVQYGTNDPTLATVAAGRAFGIMKSVYEAEGGTELVLCEHPGGHAVELSQVLNFFEAYLQNSSKA